MATKINLRRDTSANWTTVNPILSQGEPGYEIDTGKLKIGDAVTTWNSLSYYSASPLSTDEIDAITGANAPDAINVFATLADLTGGGSWGSITGTLSAQTDLQAALDGKVDENSAITGATKTKITYDSKGLITSGADATTADIPDSSNKRYVTDAQLTIIGNTSGTNTGNETTSTIGTLVNGSTAATPNDTDLVATVESSVLKKITWTNIKAFLKTYFDSLYVVLSGSYANPSWITSLAWSKITTTPTTLSGYGITDAQASDSDLTAIAGLSPSNDDIIQRKAGAWTNRTVSQFKTDLALTKSDVGLSNVDNTSDTNKPVSTAQAAADALKVDKSFPLYSFKVNNTNATANATDNTYKEISSQTLSSTGITWVGTTPPSGTETHRYRWMQIGKKVELWVTLKYVNSGTSLTGVYFPLPSDMPAPAPPDGFTGTSDNLYTGSGRLIVQTNTSVAGTNIGFSLIRENGSGGYEVFIGGSSGSQRIAMANITYWTT